MKRLFAASCLMVPLICQAQVSAWEVDIQELVGSVGVTTKQVEVSAENNDKLRLQALQAFSSTAAEASVVAETRDTVDEFGPNGQLIDGCYQVALSTRAGETFDLTTTHAATALARWYKVSDSGTAASSGIAGLLGSTSTVTQFPFAASVAQRVSRHLQRYCTVAEAEQGYCTLSANGMQGADEDFSVLLQPGKTYGWDETEASSDFTKTIAPIRATPDSSKCATPACLAAAQTRQQQEAYMSMARYSFMMFSEAHTTQKTGEAD